MLYPRRRSAGTIAMAVGETVHATSVRPMGKSSRPPRPITLGASSPPSALLQPPPPSFCRACGGATFPHSYQNAIFQSRTSWYPTRCTTVMRAYVCISYKVFISVLFLVLISSQSETKTIPPLSIQLVPLLVLVACCAVYPTSFFSPPVLSNSSRPGRIFFRVPFSDGGQERLRLYPDRYLRKRKINEAVEL